MNVERALITKIIGSGQLHEAFSRGIREDLFADEECRSMFRYMAEHYRQYNNCPTPAAIRNDRPKWEMEYVDESLEYHIDRFIEVTKLRLAQETLLELAQATNDPERSANIELEFLEASRKLATIVPSTQVARFKEMDKRIEKFEMRKKDGIRRGVPFGFPSLDSWTNGIKPHQFATVAGFTGTGKSTLLKVTAYHCWMQGYTPLYFSLEEDSEEIYERLDAMATGLDYAQIKQLDLTDEQVKKWREYADTMHSKLSDIPVLDMGRNVTPDLVYAEMVRHRPSIAIIDYLSLMKSATPGGRNVSQWQSLTEITRDLKQIARTLKIPIFAAAQTNRSGGKDGSELDNIGYSMSVNQDSDIVIGLFADDSLKEVNEVEIRLNKNRGGRLGNFRAIWNHDKMVFREKVADDFFKRQQ